jgi:hypothetical protein
LLPPAWGFVGAVDATDPAAGALLALKQLFTSPLDAALSGCWLLGVLYPANEFVSAQGCQAFPQGEKLWVRPYDGFEIFTGLMHRALRKSAHENSPSSG